MISTILSKSYKSLVEDIHVSKKISQHKNGTHIKIVYATAVGRSALRPRRGCLKELVLSQSNKMLDF